MTWIPFKSLVPIIFDKWGSEYWIHTNTYQVLYWDFDIWIGTNCNFTTYLERYSDHLNLEKSENQIEVDYKIANIFATPTPFIWHSEPKFDLIIQNLNPRNVLVQFTDPLFRSCLYLLWDGQIADWQVNQTDCHINC